MGVSSEQPSELRQDHERREASSPRGRRQPTSGVAVGDATLFAVGLGCVCVVVLCAVVAKLDAGSSARTHVGVTSTERFGDGQHTVGEGVAAGSYVSKGARTATSGPCSVTTEPAGGGAAQVRVAEYGERVVLTLGRNDAEVTVHGCRDFVRR